MIASVVSLFTFEKDLITDEFSYQNAVVKDLIIKTHSDVSLFGTESLYLMYFNYNNDIDVINEKIQAQLNSSDFIYIAIDRDLNLTMLNRVILALEKKPSIKIKFYTIHTKETLLHQLVNAVNNEDYINEKSRIEKMIEYLKSIRIKNKSRFKIEGDFTEYKVKHYEKMKSLLIHILNTAKEFNNLN